MRSSIIKREASSLDLCHRCIFGALSDVIDILRVDKTIIESDKKVRNGIISLKGLLTGSARRDC